MNSAQQVRINRVFNEKIFLIDLSKGPFDYFIKICGTTNNVYNLKLSYTGFNKGKLTCNCPDGRKIGRTSVFCKHSCFVLCKLLSNVYPFFKNTIFKLLLFNDQQLNMICEELDKFSISESDLIDHTIINKYNSYVEPDFSVKELDKDDLCPICFDNYDNKKILGCPCCKKSFHDQCINIWLMNSIEKNCPYCRSTVWKQLISPSNGNYINLS